MKVRLTQLDGKLPNLALMKLAHWHRARGDEVFFTRRIGRDLFEPEYGAVYGSAIFRFSADRVAAFQQEWPGAIVGGTGTNSSLAVEHITGPAHQGFDYGIYPDYAPSIGFTQRGCRLKCGFCVVPKKEGRNRNVAAIADIWRGHPHPKKLHLLDNDFFGQGQWRERVAEIREGGFRVCLNQGINVRLIDDEAAEALASIEYRDDQFRERRIYTAWDNIGDEAVFMAGIDRLERAGVPPAHVMAYMLIGYDRRETWERIFHRFNAMVRRGIQPYPMVYDNGRRDLKRFQRWAVTGLYRAVPWAEYDTSAKAAAARACGPTFFEAGAA